MNNQAECEKQVKNGVFNSIGECLDALYNTTSGGKKRTHKKRTHKKRTHKKRTHKKRTHKKRHTRRR
jgi:hypothetical protein